MAKKPIDRAEKQAIIAAVTSLVFMVASAISGGLWAESSLILLTLNAFFFGFLFSIVAWRRAFLVRKAREEAEEQDRISREHNRDDLFEDRDSSIARYALESFDSIGSRINATFDGIWMIGISGLVLNNLLDNEVIIGREVLPIAGFSAFLAIFALLAGAYFNGVSREAGCRWLRPVAQWIFFGAFIFVITMGVMLVEYMEIGRWEVRSSQIVSGIFILFGLEFVLNIVLEFYRPRAADDVAAPLHESRVLGFFTQPGSVAANIASWLKYQFGVDVSDTWFYSTITRLVIPMVVVGTVIMYFLGCFAMVKPHEVGIKETYIGELKREVVGSGLVFKLPAPWQRVHKIPAHRIQVVNIGFEEGASEEHEMLAEEDESYQGDKTGRVIVWDKTHFLTERYFLVASTEQADAGIADAPELSQTVPVNFLNASIPVHFRVKVEDDQAVLDYAYNYHDVHELMRGLCHREAVRYLSSVDFIEVVGSGRVAAQEALTQRIREAVDALDPPLGVEVTYVALTDIHPPVKVAEAFHEVVAAVETEIATVLKAEGDSGAMRNEALGTAAVLGADASAYLAEQSTVPPARKERFVQQRLAYEKAPRIFKFRRLMAEFRERRDLRVYFLQSGDAVLQMNLEDSMRPDVLKNLYIEDK